MFPDDKNIYNMFQISLFFSKNKKNMTQPSDSVYPKTRPLGSQKTSPWIQKNVPQDPKKRPPKAVIGQDIQGDVFLDPGGIFWDPG